MRALTEGDLYFKATPALISPGHDTMLYRQNARVEIDNISYQGLSMNIATAAPPQIAIPLPPPPTLPPPLTTENPALTPAAVPAPPPAQREVSTPSDLFPLLACDLANAVLGKRPRG